MKKFLTPTANIAFVAIMSAINAVIALMTDFIPVMSLFMILILPIISALTIIYCQGKYLSIYYISSCIICFILNLSSPENIIFSLFPSLISGSIIGFMIKRQKNPQMTIILTTLSQSIFTLITIPLVNALYQVNMFEVYRTFLKIDSLDVANLTFLPLIYVLSLIQSSFTIFICKNELEKLNISYSLNISSTFISSIISIISLILTIASIYFYEPIVYLFLSISISLGAFSIVRIFTKSSKIGVALIGTSLLLFVFLFAGLYSSIDKKYLAIIFSVIVLPFTVVDIISALLKKYLTTLKKIG